MSGDWAEDPPSRPRAVLDEDDRGGDFGPLTQEMCVQLLRTKQVGRVAWQAADGPQILPVTYAWYEDRVVFRTSPYGVLSELLRPTDVAMEIDEIDQDRHSGWSVVVHGQACAVAEPVELNRLWAGSGVVPWAGGVRNLFIEITPRRISGRAVAARQPH